MAEIVVRMMETENKENIMFDDSKTAQNVAPSEEFELDNNFPCELDKPMWSVVTYETVAASGLTYDEAAKLAKSLKKKRISGLCIITDEAARRIAD